MFQILLGDWKKKVKIIDDESLFKVLFLSGLAVGAMIAAICEIYLMNHKEYLMMILLNTFLVIYNKPTILCSVMQRKNIAFMIKREVLFRFVMFQILRENALIAVFAAVQVPVFLYSLYSMKFAVVLAMWVFAADVYLLDIYQQGKKLTVFMLGACLCIWTIRYNMCVLLLFAVGNTWYLYGTLRREIVASVFVDRTRNVLIGKKKLSIGNVNSLFFLRMSLQELAELLFEVILMCVMRYFVQADIVFYLFVAFVLVDMELVQDNKMRNYDTYYGKNQFLSFTKITERQKFLLSVEFCYVIKYILLSLPLLLMEVRSQSLDFYFVFEYFNVLILILAISIRYYQASGCVLKIRKLIEHTWFRMVMLYLVLFDLAPVLFKKVLMELEGYEPYYGCIFAACMTGLMLFVKIENIVKVAGRDAVEKRE